MVGTVQRVTRDERSPVQSDLVPERFQGLGISCFQFLLERAKTWTRHGVQQDHASLFFGSHLW